ncbi:MAG: M48 family metallopeptidase [Terriglobia bacterium]
MRFKSLSMNDLNPVRSVGAASFGVRQLAAAFSKASLLAAAYPSSAASKLAGAKRRQAAALQSFRICKGGGGAASGQRDVWCEHQTPSRRRVILAHSALAFFMLLCLLGAAPARASLGMTRLEEVFQEAAKEAGQSPSSQTSPASASKAQGENQAGKTITGYHLSPEKYRQAVAYSRAGYRLYFISVAWGAVILLLVLSLKLGPIFRKWAEGGGRRNGFLQALIYTPLLLITLAILGLPTDIYSHWLELKYQQSVQGWASWLGDWTKGQGLAIVLGIFLVWILYAIIRRSARRWWFYFWLVSIPIIIFLLFISPLVIDPLFYKFTPLQSTQPQLVAQMEKVLDRAGLIIPPKRMFEMNASAKLKSVDAYVTGIGSSKRVVVWDTAISKMTVPETLFVFGHETGHYVLGHIWKGILFTIGLLFVLLLVGYRLLYWAVGRWGPDWKIRGVEDLASLPVILLIVVIFMFLASPGINGFSRYQEHQADQYGLEVVHGLVPDESQVAARSFQILGEIDLGDPNPSPFIKFWLFSHPPLKERIDFALHYDPWAQGGHGEFVK